uniref:Uncharacterized protein n=1 Tax=Anguilla anguilla TaxID=7936 RepID=A0A0E9RK38_ANGAN
MFINTSSLDSINRIGLINLLRQSNRQQMNALFSQSTSCINGVIMRLL